MKCSKCGAYRKKLHQCVSCGIPACGCCLFRSARCSGRVCPECFLNSGDYDQPQLPDDREAIQPGDERYYRMPGGADR